MGWDNAMQGWECAMKLLLVEDDRRIATTVKRGLEAEGFTVEVAFDGNDGLWMASEGSYDLLVLDIVLPGRNGYRICADLRASGNWTPILMLTAKDGDLDEGRSPRHRRRRLPHQAVLVPGAGRSRPSPGAPHHRPQPHPPGRRRPAHRPWRMAGLARRR